MTTMTSAMPASGRVRWNHGREASSGSTRSSLGVSEYTRPRSSSTGFGLVTRDTTTLSTTSTTNATLAARNAGPWPASGITPLLQEPNASSVRNAIATADDVPATRPTQPAVAVIRFQNMPRMNVANNGALKNPNSTWR